MATSETPLILTNEEVSITIDPPPAPPTRAEYDETFVVEMCRDVVKQQVEKQLEKNADGHYLIEQDVAFKNILKVLEEAYKLRDEKKKRDIIKVIVKAKGIENLRDSEHYTLFRKLLDKPDLVGLMLDECYWFEPKKKNHFKFFCCHIKEELHADFKFLEDLEQIGGKGDSTTSSGNAVQPHVLEVMFDQDKDCDLFLHPVVMSLLNCKWTSYMVLFFLINLVFYLVFLGFLTAFAMYIPNPEGSVCTGVYTAYADTENDTANATASSCGLSTQRRSFLIAAAVITIVFSVLRLLLEVCQIVNLSDMFNVHNKRDGYEKITKNGKYTWFIKWEYFTSPINYVEITLYTLSLLFISVIRRECLCPSYHQWQAGAMALFLAWLNLLLFMNKWPGLGIYISMLLKIILNFVKVSIIALFLIISFGFGFYLAFYEPELPDTPFENLIVTFVTMISYAISSPDISIFRLTNDAKEMDSIPYSELSFFIWILFGIIMSVLFLNFLVGLAVDDVQALRKEASKERIKQLIKLFIHVEETKSILFPQRFQNNREKDIPTDGVASQAFYVKFGILWGDDTRNIISYAKKQRVEIEKMKEKSMQQCNH